MQIQSNGFVCLQDCVDGKDRLQSVTGANNDVYNYTANMLHPVYMVIVTYDMSIISDSGLCPSLSSQ